MGRVLTAITVIGFLAITALAQEGGVPLVLPHRSGPGLTGPEYPVPPRESLTVPAETQVSVQVLSGIHTKVNHPNDLVTARLVQPVYVD